MHVYLIKARVRADAAACKNYFPEAFSWVTHGFSEVAVVRFQIFCTWVIN